MKRLPHTKVLFALIASAAALGTAEAAETVYSDLESYSAAAGADDFCLDFNGSTGALVSGDSFSSSVTFTSPEASDPTQVNWNSDAISDAGSTTDSLGVGPLGGTFAGTAQAFHFTLSSSSNAPSIELYDEADALFATVNAPGGTGFFGVVSDTPVKRFVIRNGLFEDSTRDRFFIDDFCATAEVASEPPPATDLDTLCHDLAAAVEAADVSAFGNQGKKGALLNKLDVVCRHIGRGDAKGYCKAIQKLVHDIHPKTDGEGSPSDFVTDPTVQQALEDQISALIAALEAEVDALGGCKPKHAGGHEEQAHGNSGGNGKGKGHNK